MAHIGDDAELYALGALDDVSARRVEQHILECAECAARVNDALLAAAALAEALPSTTASAELARRLSESAERSEVLERSTRQSTGWFSDRVLRYAVAAALVLALLDAGWQSFRLHREIAVQDVALATLVHGHFNHVSMTPLSRGALAAKILYARDGSWLYVIADRPNGELRVMGYGSRTATSNRPSAALDLGTMSADGRTATLMAHPRSRLRRIVLERGNVPVAEATLTY